MPSHRKPWLPILTALLLAAASCGDDSETETGSATGADAEAAAAETQAGEPAVTEVWARSTAEGQPSAAVYLAITSEATASLVAASAPTEVAGAAELHETVAVDPSTGDAGEGADDSMEDMEDMEDMDGMEDMEDMDGMEGMDGAMTMQPVDEIALPAGETVTLEPGGLHIMLLDLAGPLAAGDTFPLTLTLDDGTDLTVEVEVRDQQP